jgi:flagellar basal-body rod protein FlgB
MDTGIVNILQFAIDGVTAQQNATANNLANAQTPNFAASDVSFEQSLQAAINNPGTQSAEVTTTPSTSAMASDGNNVNLGQELINAQDETLHYSAISESINGQFRLISGVTGGTFQ